MKKAIELFTSLTGWSSTGTISAAVLNADPHYAAEHLGTSVAFHVPAGNLGQSVTKTVAVDLTGYDELVLSVWSRRKAAEQFDTAVDYAYAITVDGMHTYLLPTWPGFGQVSIGIAGVTAATQVTITALHNDDDYLLLSGLYAVREELPLDVMQAVVDEITYQAGLIIPTGVAIGTATTVAGATSFLPSARKFLDRYAVVQLSGTAGTEIHQIDSWEEGSGGFTLMSTFGGKTLQYSQAATVSLLIPAAFGTTETELLAPGIAVWGMAPDPRYPESDVQEEADSAVLGGGEDVRRDDMHLAFPLLIDCESRHNETLALASRIVRRFLGQGYLWINGRKHDLWWSQPAEQILPTVPVETLPKVQYTIDALVRERREARAAVLVAGPATLTGNILTEVIG